MKTIMNENNMLAEFSKNSYQPDNFRCVNYSDEKWKIEICLYITF